MIEAGPMKLKLLVFSLALPLMIGAIGSFFTIESIPTWYATLNKPGFSPPNYIFGPVWTILYILMGVSLYLVLSSKKKNKKAVQLFFIQLFLNLVWSLVFFKIQHPVAGLIDIILLWIAILMTIKEFLKIKKEAAYLLYPYLAWVTFAAILNLAIVLLNKSVV